MKSKSPRNRGLLLFDYDGVLADSLDILSEYTNIFCREHDISITARGGGTSQAGQAIGSGLQLDFSKHFGNLLELQP